MKLEEKTKPLFEKFPHLKENYCANCLGLVEVQTEQEDEDVKNCDIYKMDTGRCAKCGNVKEVLNPLIYSIAKINNLKIYGKTKRIYKEDIYRPM